MNFIESGLGNDVGSFVESLFHHVLGESHVFEVEFFLTPLEIQEVGVVGSHFGIQDRFVPDSIGLKELKELLVVLALRVVKLVVHLNLVKSYLIFVIGHDVDQIEAVYPILHEKGIDQEWKQLELVAL